MTVQVDTGPGNDDWRSGKFTATINDAPTYVWAATRVTSQGAAGWANGATIEQSQIDFGADETVTVVIALADSSPIFSAAVYPGNAGVTQSIAGGLLTLVVPPDVQLRVEINQDRGEGALILCSSPLSSPPGNVVDFATLVKTVDGVEGNGMITSAGHGFTGTVRILFHTDGDLPTTTVGTLKRFHPVTGVVVDANTIQLVDPVSEANYEFSDEGTGTKTIVQTEWLNTDNHLYFGPGEHVAGHQFLLPNGAHAYVAMGAVVTATWDFGTARNQAGGAHIDGLGKLCGDVISRTELIALPGGFEDWVDYCVFAGIGDVETANDSTVSGVTILSFPFYLSLSVLRHFDHVKALSPWWWSTDGIRTSVPYTNGLANGASDCLMLVGDDAFSIMGDKRTFERCFAITTSNSCYHGGYWARFSSESNSRIVDCHAMHIGLATGELGADTILKSLVDGYEADSSLMHAGVEVTNLRIWGPLIVVPIALGNIPYPWLIELRRDQHGQLFDWNFDGLWFEQTPALKSHIVGLNGANTPHDLTFTNLQIGGVDVYDDNFEDFFEVSVYAYRINWDERPAEPVVEPDPVLDESESLSQAMCDAPDIAAYTTATGVSVTRRSVDEMIKLDRHLRAQQARARGLRQTRVRFR